MQAAVLMTVAILYCTRSRAVQRSTLGCSNAYYMLTNSIPLSCNAALDRITTSLQNISQSVDYGDICSPYCSAPLKQAALECQEIEDIFSHISSRCCRNNQNQRCFSLTGHATLLDLVAECGQYSTDDNCSSTCSEAMAEATQALGCCLPALLTSYEPLLNYTLWQQCQQDGLSPACTECNTATATTSITGQAVLVAVAALSRALLL